MPKAEVEVSSTSVRLYALGSHLPFGTERFRAYSVQLQFSKERNTHQFKSNRECNGKRNKETDKHIRHLATAFAGVSQKGTPY